MAFFVDSPEFRSASPTGLSYVNRGSSIRFSCLFDGVPRPLVDWYFNGAKVSANSSSNYDVIAADRANDGEYRCQGRNLVGTTDGAVVTLKVRGLLQEPLSNKFYSFTSFA